MPEQLHFPSAGPTFGSKIFVCAPGQCLQCDFQRMRLMLVEIIFIGFVIRVSGSNQIQVTVTDGKKSLQSHYNVNASMALNCSVTGIDISEAIMFEWRQNGIRSSTMNTTKGWSVLRISNLSLSNGGYYQCQVNQQGPKAGLFVNIKGKPQIIKCCDGEHHNKNPFLYHLNDDKTLVCYATGWPLPDIQWFRNGVKLTLDHGTHDGTYKLVQVKNGGVELRLFGMTKQSRGKYTCKARNAYGTDSYHYNLELIDPLPGKPEVSAMNSQAVAVVDQGNITLTCKGKYVHKINSDPYWLHNGKELDESSRYAIGTYYDSTLLTVDMQLTIFNITANDDGNYNCTIYVGTDIIWDSIYLTVKTKGTPHSPAHRALPYDVIITVSVFAGLMLLVLVVFIVYKYRHKKRFNPPKIPRGPFKYGAFITYSSHDYPWIKANLLPFLEGNGVKTCIHYRNFDIGEVLEQNIVNCIYTSRVVIAVISKNYLKSNYCKYELEMAVHRSIEEADVNPLIALKIDKSLKNLPLAIKRRTFLDLTSDVEEDTWRARLLIHVKGNKDKNQNNGEKQEEIRALMGQDGGSNA